MPRATWTWGCLKSWPSGTSDKGTGLKAHGLTGHFAILRRAVNRTLLGLVGAGQGHPVRSRKVVVAVAAVKGGPSCGSSEKAPAGAARAQVIAGRASPRVLCSIKARSPRLACPYDRYPLSDACSSARKKARFVVVVASHTAPPFCQDNVAVGKTVERTNGFGRCSKKLE